MEKTIFALSSGMVPSGVAVIRVSGGLVRFVLETLSGSVPKPREATLAPIVSRESGGLIDRGLILFFPAPRSFTGEDVCEFHIHGGRAVVSALLGELAAIPGLLLAEPGAFTRRAFENGRMDLTAVEGLSDLIAADTEFQRRQALSLASGHLREQAERWRGQLVRMRSMIEAELDFSDEDDVPDSFQDEVDQILQVLHEELTKAVGGAKRGERLRDGLEIVLMGRPNAGKSSFLNILANRDVAIVAEEAGTTRDLIEVHLDLNGYPVTVVDTAGLRHVDSLIEKEGIKRAKSRGNEADLVLWLDPLDDPDDAVKPADGINAPVWIVGTKRDLIDSDSKQILFHQHNISNVTGQGLEELLAELNRFASEMVSSGDALTNRLRHEQQLRDALEAVVAAMPQSLPIEIRSEYLRAASDALARLVGRIDVEDLLDAIFSEFCIGK